ncbi:unnamed protein product [Meganyctiphanes norvegica]|uniref:Uncharacterized protein n=1 Tax=Meganyctiphanes norvegica TaxID=48144 RepID=A0AAV2RKV5_MEGNR
MFLRNHLRMSTKSLPSARQVPVNKVLLTPMDQSQSHITSISLLTELSCHSLRVTPLSTDRELHLIRLVDPDLLILIHLKRKLCTETKGFKMKPFFFIALCNY